MYVRVEQLTWVGQVPIARVQPVDAGGTAFQVCLLHHSFLVRARIGLGTILQISPVGFVEQIVETVGEVLGPPSDKTEFEFWVAFRRRLAHLLQPKVLYLLFLSGITTYEQLVLQRNHVLNISGIGPVTNMRIQEILGPSITGPA